MSIGLSWGRLRELVLRIFRFELGQLLLAFLLGWGWSVNCFSFYNDITGVMIVLISLFEVALKRPFYD